MLVTDVASALLVQLDEQAGLSPSGNPTSWHIIFPEGVYHHPAYGVLDFRAPFFGEVKQHFDERVRKIDVCIDLHHENKEAGGWIQELEYRPGVGLAALIEWTVLGVEKVKQKLLRYFSPEFGKFQDPRTKQVYRNVLSAVTLTNFPFLKELPAVEMQLSDLRALETAELRYLEDKYPDVDDSDFAGPHHSFPIRNANDVKDAWDLRGHADDPAAVAAAIVRIATRKGLSLPAGAGEGDTQRHSDEESVMCAACTKPTAQCSCEQDDPGMTDERELADTTTEDAAEGQADPKSKPKVKKNAGNEGAPQPHMPRGAKPHINRGRQPDPTGEMSNMSDAENTPQTVTLDEFRAASAKLEETIATERTAREAAEKRLALMEREAFDRSITDEVRTLSEVRTVRATDGGTEVTARFGIPTVVTDQYRTFATENPTLREPVLDMLRKLTELGTVTLSERGTGATGVEHDPLVRKSLSTTDSDGNTVLGEDTVRKAREIATRDGLNFAKLSERELAFQRAIAESK